jgi:hypothetical protein
MKVNITLLTTITCAARASRRPAFGPSEFAIAVCLG